MFNMVCWLSHAQEMDFKNEEKKFPIETFQKKFLFHWVESGTSDWRSLKSVAEPNMFLFVEKGRGKEKVTINSVKEPSFKIVKGILSNVCNFYI